MLAWGIYGGELNDYGGSMRLSIVVQDRPAHFWAAPVIECLDSPWVRSGQAEYLGWNEGDKIYTKGYGVVRK